MSASDAATTAAPLTAQSWPIGAQTLYFAIGRDGAVAQDAGPRASSLVFEEIVHAGFAHLDLTGSRVRQGDMDVPGRWHLGAGAAHVRTPREAKLARRAAAAAPHPVPTNDSHAAETAPGTTERRR